MKSKTVVIFFSLFFLVFASGAEAHRDGCHAAHSCPSDTGSYVCGDTGNFSECGGSAPAQSAPAQNAPAPTTAPVKQLVAPPATSIPTKIPTAIPTVKPTTKPTTAPAKKVESKPTTAVASSESSGNPVIGFVILGILGGLGYLGYNKLRKRNASEGNSNQSSKSRKITKWVAWGFVILFIPFTWPFILIYFIYRIIKRNKK